MNIYELIKNIELQNILMTTVCIILMLLSLQDIKKLQVSVKLLGALALISLLTGIDSIVIGDRKLWMQMLLLIPGSVLILLNLTDINIMGMADSVIIMCLGMVFNIVQYVVAVSVALLLVFIWAAVVLAWQKFRVEKKKQKIAMVPFLCMGTLVGSLL